ncbi:MAG: CHAT domain-containing protein [Saprospiraceae bacterium]|nr:CHAT domain-containing protein [Saprospiraceae bacterium]
MDKKAQIQELISLGKTEEALELLEELTSDAVLLQSRFNGAKRQYSMGMIDFSEWSRTQAQINYAALEMVNTVKGPATQSPRPSSPLSPGPVRPELLKILMLTANPAGTTKLNLDKEYARISEKLQTEREKFNLTVRRAVNRTEFKEFTENVQPMILHFSGHGEQGGKMGGILVQNEDKNDYEIVSPEKLESLFEYFNGEFSMQAVVLNACFSQEQAAAIARHVPYVVGTTDAVIDEHAISFSTGFYFKLVHSGPNYEQAFKSGRMEAVMAGANKADFILFKDSQIVKI